MNKTIRSAMNTLLLIGGFTLAQPCVAQVWPQPESAYQNRQHSPQWIENRHIQSPPASQGTAPNGYLSQGMPYNYTPNGYRQTPPYYRQDMAPRGYYQPGYGTYPNYSTGYNTPWNNWRNGNWDMGNWSMPNMSMPDMNMPNMPSPNFDMPSPSFNWPNMSMPFWN